VRELRVGDVDSFLKLLAKTSPAKELKHLRVLHAILKVAVKRGLTSRNVVNDLEPSERPSPDEKRPSYFTDAELARLWPELANYLPVYDCLCQVALTTGCRMCELLALRWSDLSLLERELMIQRGYVAGIGEQTTKSGKERTVDLTPAALSALEGWCRPAARPTTGSCSRTPRAATRIRPRLPASSFTGR
jgi:integrase